MIVDLEDDGILAMLDSGSFLTAMSAEIDLPGHLIEIIDGGDKANSAETECGAVLKDPGLLAPQDLLMARKSM